MKMRQKLLCAGLKAKLSGARPPLPEGSMPFWRAFTALSAARSYHQFGPNPISHAEIAAYAALMRMPLAPHHVEILRAMDATWLEHAYERSGGGSKSGAAPRSRQPLTAPMFDAMFG